MSFILTKNAGVPVKYTIEGYLETAAELATLRTDFTLGSKIIVIENGKQYVLTDDGWTYLHDVTVEEINKLKAEIQSLSKLKNWLGDTTTPLYNGSTANPIVISGNNVTARPGDVARYQEDQFIFSEEGTWQPYDDTLDVYTKDEVDALLDGKMDKTGGQFTGDVTTTNTSFTNTSFVTKQYVDMQSITYSALKTLRDNSQLVPGKYYRITDYQTTTVQEDTQSAGNQFDIIVKANDSKTLDENAGAIQHTDSSSDYFYDQNLAAWQLKYDIDNDTNKYAWADSTNGKGVIYWMKDEYDNECGYDFKNIQFKRYKITARNDDTKPSFLVNKYYGVVKKFNDSITLYPDGYTFSASDVVWRYTFNLESSGTKDYSLNIYIAQSVPCYGNKIEKLYGISEHDHKLQYLANIVFLNSSGYSKCRDNYFKSKNYTMTFGSDCYDNSFGSECEFNNFGDSCYSNNFNDGCYSNNFGEHCTGNTFGNSFHHNNFGDMCYANIFGDRCGYNNFGSGFCSNILNSGCGSNNFGNSCSDNVLGSGCYYNNFGNNCDYNNVGIYCLHKTISANTSNQTIGVTNFTDDVTTSNTVFSNTSFITKEWVNDNAKAITDVTALPTGSNIKDTVYRLATYIPISVSYDYTQTNIDNIYSVDFNTYDCLTVEDTSPDIDTPQYRIIPKSTVYINFGTDDETLDFIAYGRADNENWGELKTNDSWELYTNEIGTFTMKVPTYTYYLGDSTNQTTTQIPASSDLSAYLPKAGGQVTGDVTTTNTTFGNTSFVTKQWVENNTSAAAIVDVNSLPTGNNIEDVVYRLVITANNVTTYEYYLGDSTNHTLTQIEDKEYIDERSTPYWVGTKAEYNALQTPLPDGTLVYITDEGISYDNLSNKPSVNNITLSGNKTGADLGLVDAVSGKGLSTNDYTNEEKSKLSGIAAGAEVNVQSDWNETNSSSDVYIQNKPTLGSAAAKDSINAVTENDTRLIESGAVYNYVNSIVGDINTVLEEVL